MDKQRQEKILIIVALVLAVSAMTLGFAAFSTTLNISSSASVTPNSEDFKIKFISMGGDGTVPVVDTNVVGSSFAMINEDGMSISGIDAKLKQPGDYVTYGVLVENVGKYNAYLSDIYSEKIDGKQTQKCIAVGSDYNQDLLTYVCNLIYRSYKVYDGNNLEISDRYSTVALAPGDRFYIELKYGFIGEGEFSDTLEVVNADTDFTVEYGDIHLDFATAIN